jgi:hypothetical protein
MKFYKNIEIAAKLKMSQLNRIRLVLMTSYNLDVPLQDLSLGQIQQQWFEIFLNVTYNLDVSYMSNSWKNVTAVIK